MPKPTLVDPNINASLRNLAKELEFKLLVAWGREWKMTNDETPAMYAHRYLLKIAAPCVFPGGVLPTETAQTSALGDWSPVEEDEPGALAHAIVQLYGNCKILKLQNLVENETDCWSRVIIALKEALPASRKMSENTADRRKLAERLLLLANFGPAMEELLQTFPEASWPSKALLEETKAESLRVNSDAVERELAKTFEVPIVARLIDDGLEGNPRTRQNRVRKRLERSADKDKSDCPHFEKGWVVPLDDQDPCTTIHTHASSPHTPRSRP